MKITMFWHFETKSNKQNYACFFPILPFEPLLKTSEIRAMDQKKKSGRNWLNVTWHYLKKNIVDKWEEQFAFRKYHPANIYMFKVSNRNARC